MDPNTSTTPAYHRDLFSSVKFDESKHKTCLSHGCYELSKDGDELLKIEATRKGQGFGVAVFREWMKICIVKNYAPEQITVNAVITSKGDPFYFYVLMGMIPLAADNMKHYVGHAEKISYIAAEFIPAMIQVQRKILATYPSPFQYSQKSGLWSQVMCFSKEGLARWKSAIENDIVFEPFKYYEHMPLNELQQNEMRDIIRSMKEIKAGVFTFAQTEVSMHEWSKQIYVYGNAFPKLNETLTSDAKLKK